MKNDAMQTADEIAKACELFADAQFKADCAALPSKGSKVDCRRCGGKGYGPFLGVGTCADCFGCNGTGKTFRFVNKAERIAHERGYALAALARLRVLFRGYSLAAQFAAVAAEEPGARWSAKHSAKEAADRVARIVEAGKAAAAAVKGA